MYAGVCVCLCVRARMCISFCVFVGGGDTRTIETQNGRYTWPCNPSSSGQELDTKCRVADADDDNTNNNNKKKKNNSNNNNNY